MLSVLAFRSQPFVKRLACCQRAYVKCERVETAFVPMARRVDRRIHTLVALRDELDGCIGLAAFRAVIARCVTRATA